MKAVLTLLIMLASVLPVKAQQSWFGNVEAVGFHMISHHDPKGGANNFNPGAYVRTDRGFLLGGYYNSWYRPSAYVGWNTGEWYRMSLSAVVATGYDRPLTPVIIPSVRLYTTESNLSFYLSGSPTKLTKEGQSVIHLSMQVPWN